MTGNSNLISAEQLAATIDNAPVRIVDCRFDLADPDAGRRSYLKGHIPGAVFADLDKDLSAPVTPQSGRHPLPDPDRFALTCQRLGIGNATDVVVYDQNNGSLAARAWWMLRWLGHDRVRLLDGGFERWIALANAVHDGFEPIEPGEFVASECTGRILTTAELTADITTIPGMRLLDARDAARFRGEIEPIDPVAGHIPGSINVPFSVSLNADGTWKSSDELVALWRSVLGENTAVDWAVMCGSGVTACHLALSGVEAGCSEPRLYVGSWSEWIGDRARPIGLGEGESAGSSTADMA